MAEPTGLFDGAFREYGDLFTTKNAVFGTEIIVCNPEHIKRVFTGDPDALHAGEANSVLAPLAGATSVLLIDGPAHLRVRRLLLPPFHGERMTHYVQTMIEITERTTGAWPEGEPFPLHPHMQRITLEVILRTVFGLDDGPRLTELRDHLARLLDKESLRLRPVIPVVGRRLKVPLTLRGYDLPEGIMVVPCVYLAQRHPDFWPDPARFLPERFLGKRPDPYTWFPFGGGPRRCIGMAFALYEMKAVLATMLSRVRLRLAQRPLLKVVLRAFAFAPKGGARVVAARTRG
jgi:cytochrome P450